MSAPLLTEPISEEDLAGGFDCGVPELNLYFERHALPNHQRGIGRSFVLRTAVQGDEPRRVRGYYTLGMATLAGELLPRKMRSHLPRYPLPVTLLGRLAVDLREQGSGLGRVLMGDAFRRVLRISEDVGCFAVAVDAKSEAPQAFYAKLGFFSVGEPGVYPHRMVIRLDDVRSVVEVPSQ